MLLLLILAPAPTSALGLLPRIGRVPASPSHPGVPDCTKKWHEQLLDHFDFSEQRVWRQRYFTFDKHWSPGGPTLFYCGNEASVELYVNATGLMWERAASLGARLVFAEHRYCAFSRGLTLARTNAHPHHTCSGRAPSSPPVLPADGASMPLGAASTANASNMRWLTMEQALADYASLIYALRADGPPTSAVIALGGSYGGMLAAWLRMHYPSAVAGAIAASAPGERARAAPRRVLLRV